MRHLIVWAVGIVFLSACQYDTFRDKGLLGVMMESSQPNKLDLPDFGMKKIISNPSVPASQAYAICEPQARNARRGASNSYASASAKPQQFNCEKDYWGNYNCLSSPTGGVWSGINEGLGSSQAGSSAYTSVMDSCLAVYGWTQ